MCTHMNTLLHIMDIKAESRNSEAKRKGRCEVTAGKHVPAATSASFVARQWHSKHVSTSSNKQIM
jgi:hypothetical protein